MDQRFPPQSRLHNGRDYGRVFNRQQKAPGRHVVVLVRTRKSKDEPARLGIMIAAKTVPLAVRRHQLKRWVRELFRTRLQDDMRGHDMVVLFRNDPPDQAHQALDEEITRLTSRAMHQPQSSSGGADRRDGRSPKPDARSPKPRTHP